MKIIAPEAYGNKADLPNLIRFLGDVQREARSDDHWKLVSISLRVDEALDPRDVLEAIYESGEQHAYFERPQEGFSLAGAEAVLAQTYSGVERFAQVQAFADEALEHTIAVGHLEAAQSGPHFFCAFGFYDEPETPQPVFAPASVFVPRWQVSLKEDRFTAVAHIVVKPQSNVLLTARRVWKAYQRLKSFRQGQGHGQKDTVSEKWIQMEVKGSGPYEQRVEQALQAIDSGKYDKIVLSRAIDAQAHQTVKPTRCLGQLRKRFAGCTTFSFARENGASFIGATPEFLLRSEQGQLYTEAIAGSAARGDNPAEDEALGRALMESEKDAREHEAVAASIERRLKALGITAQRMGPPELLKLANVQHLRTGFGARLQDGQHLLQALRALHPTPAVGGSPRAAALEALPALEGFPRGLFAGALGWFDHHGDGQFVVGLRSALVQGQNVRAYAGAGIVAGSDPSMERAETDLKFRALLEALH